MSEARHFSAETYLALKATFRDLVKLSGGRDRAARLTRGAPVRISEAMDGAYPERFPAIDQVADLESECGQPLMARHLAAMAGFQLVPAHELTERAALPATPHSHLVAVMRECGEVEQTLAEAAADGAISWAERIALLFEIDEAVLALNSLRHSLLKGERSEEQKGGKHE